MKSCNLVLHCGAAAVERSQVRSVPTPFATPTWTPIPHLRLVEQVERALAAAQLEIVNQAHALSHGGDRYFGLIQVATARAASDYALVLGLRNSHDKRFAEKAKRILILAPANVCRQWQVELREKFNLNLPLYDGEKLVWMPTPARPQGVEREVFRGKRLQGSREVVSIPLGRRWRAIFRYTPIGYPTLGRF